MMASAVLAVLVTAFMGVLFSVQTGLGKQTDRSTSNDQARLAVEQLDREIRSGNLLYDPAVECVPVDDLDAACPPESDIVPGMALRVYTQTNANSRAPGNRCVQWRITSDRELQRRDWSINWQLDGIYSPWRVVAEHIVNRSVVPPVTAFEVNDPTIRRTIVIDILAQEDADSGQPARIQLSVTGRNTQYGYPGNICGGATRDVPPY
jgi:hypothetical protein